ncbi:MAG TPA: zinc ribbon domain-containing protein [Vicinamibacterales bacterium]|nr:zinc ribbon domain-containing protein [Vicinamibacterales bacterium]
MPIFDFKCRACGEEFEALVLPGRDGSVVCRACASGDVERQLSSFAVSSAEKTTAAATAQRRKAASQAYKDNAAAEREIDAHRKEDH